MKRNLTHLLMLPVGFTLSLLFFRILYSENVVCIFFVWNLFLAAVPLMISSFLLITAKKKSQLIFFPNALYIITDLIHLKERENIPLWFVVILIFSAAINGLLMAFISLYQVEIFLRSKFSDRYTNLILSGCMFLSSFGIYLGRFLRWNSWDVLTDPAGLGFEIIEHFIKPFQHTRTWSMTFIFTLFFVIFYFIIKKIPGLLANRD